MLRFGIAWPDGGRATNVGTWGRRWPDATEPAHGLEEHGGSGGLRENAQEYWAWPLPGPGELRFVAEWPAYGIPETAASIDAGLLVAAAARGPAGVAGGLGQDEPPDPRRSRGDPPRPLRRLVRRRMRR